MRRVSHLFNDPVSHASFVWLPSGVAVGAYLLTARRHWPMLMAGLFCAQLILSFWRGQAATALVFAITAALSSLLAAWTVQRLTPREGDVSFVAALLAGAVAGAASSALLGGGWSGWRTRRTRCGCATGSRPTWPVCSS